MGGEEALGPPQAAARLEKVKAEVERALSRASRSPGAAAILAVSKTFSAGDVSAFLAAGQLDFGESYIQEAKAKIPLVPQEARWHFIGHLQANKAKQAASLFGVLHALDSLHLAEALNRHLSELGRSMRVYLQVNVSGEGAKSGMEPSELPAFLDGLAKFPALAPEGLMTMPPYDPDPEASRPYFAALR